MERNFRALELRGREMGTVVKDREDDLTLFIEMRKREKERINLLLRNSEELDPSVEAQPGGFPTFNMLQPTVRKTNVDDFLNSDNEKSDYDWLLTPPGTPLFPYLDKVSQRSPEGGSNGTPKGHPTLLKSRLTNPADSSSRTMATSRQMASSSSINSSMFGMRRPSSSGGCSATSSRPATPNGRPTVSAAVKLPRSSTPTSRPTLPSKLPVAQPRSSTPGRSSTPTRSSILPASKPASRSNTPTRRPSIPLNLHANSAPASRSSSVIKSGTGTNSSPGTSSMARSNPATASVSSSGPVISSITRLGPSNSVPRSVLPANSVPRSVLPANSVSKSSPTSSKIAAPSRGTSPTVRSRPWKPSEMPGFSFDAPPNLRTTLPDRSSPSRGRPGAASSRSSSIENGPIARPRRQSSSPSRGRAPKGNAVSGCSVPASSRSRMNGYDDESPVVIGTKMVERVVNLRRLAPPKHDDMHSNKNSSVKSSLPPDSTGFGRTLSKKSLDMAMRHMDIRRSIPNTLRPLMSNIPASSLYSVRSGSIRSRAASVSDSPLATSSNASSEQSVSNSVFCYDGNEIEHDICSEKWARSSPSFFLAR